jgi:hypothetical protein
MLTPKKREHGCQNYKVTDGTAGRLHPKGQQTLSAILPQGIVQRFLSFGAFGLNRGTLIWVNPLNLRKSGNFRLARGPDIGSIFTVDS